MAHRFILLALLLVTSVTHAGGVTGRGGLEALAVAPDGKVIAVGGQNRVIYLIDAEKMEVLRRIWLGARIGSLAFNKDGTRLAVEDETDQLHLLDVANGKTLAKVAQTTGLVANSADLLVTRDLSERVRNRLRFLSMRDLAEIAKVELPERPVTWTLHPGGKTLVVFTGSRTGEEKRIPPAEMPRELRGLARSTFRQKNDGLEADLLDIDLASAKITRTVKTWYTSDSDSTQLVLAGDLTYVFNRLNLCARIGPRGETTLLETAQSVNHALSSSADGRALLIGGLGGGYYGPVEGGKGVEFRLEPLPGQSEFFNRFVFQSDGSAWGVTTAYRLVRINKFARIDKVQAVY
jgi:hypothetical protein